MVKNIILLIVLLALGAFAFYLFIGTEENEAAQSETSDAAPIVDVRVDGVVDDALNQEVPVEEIIESDAGVAPEQITLDAVDARGGTAVAERTLGGGELLHTVVADVSDPRPGKFYEGWLVQPNPLKFYSTGKMEKNAEGQYVLTYIRTEDEEARYPRVVITEETEANGLDGVPEVHIFEGNF